MRPARLLSVLLATVLLVAACGSGGGAATNPPAGGASVTVGVATSASLGQILTGANGMTLYTHAGDTATTSSCTGTCATTWPPLFVTGGAQAALGSGVTGAVASFTRSDGMGTQVTYNGKPLYYWTGDKVAGDTTGQGVEDFVVATP
jgi:predicted lipoprotein with Yx(FWY)xxD motif